jgi:hypothetical protein
MQQNKRHLRQTIPRLIIEKNFDSVTHLGILGKDTLELPAFSSQCRMT